MTNEMDSETMTGLPTIATMPDLTLRGSDVHDARTGAYVGMATPCPVCDELILYRDPAEDWVDPHRSYHRSDGSYAHWTWEVACGDCLRSESPQAQPDNPLYERAEDAERAMVAHNAINDCRAYVVETAVKYR